MKTKSAYVCTACKAVSPRWQGQCPKCLAWNTLEPAIRQSGSAMDMPLNRPVDLRELPTLLEDRVSSQLSGLDGILGSGFVPGGVILLGGEPGIGKSTLLLQVGASMERSGKGVIYVSGEESLSQIRGRAERLGMLGDRLTALATNQVDDILACMEDAPALIVVDSVQTMISSRVEGLPGSVSQVRAVATALTERAKQTGVTVILVGHVTKDGQIAGPKLLEHMVDTVLYLEGDKEHLFRILRVVKNRFGPSNEILLFEMREKGMSVIEDPSTFFLQARDTALSGTALVMSMESQRPFVVEVQALVTRTFLAFPRRTALGFDANRLHLLIAVMEKRLQISLGQVDVYAKVGGGLRMKDPGLDLGIVAAILSSFYDRSLPEGAVFWGEVDLNGQIRPVTGHDVRLRQAANLGYAPMVHPKTGARGKGWSRLGDVQRMLFGQTGKE
ncbi:DNA repair protein RadA/Sms [Desulfomicrobium norvegicum]|uniref:DNA repair protein RadA n=1 Tax=Desulfomicrobium norvegicum (strain DSM 1741 / NCIMB 8310) TaxID=52561 RepID=A0A8G2C249_DESNO|nr:MULTISPECIES: DNA repair protein RadA [Desulfomicrobium]SFL61190.1 DNA repair protein RadA/Sms [Desulfomicrobium norvegicum]